MKKTFHLGIIAMAAILVTSCSKTDELVANERSNNVSPATSQNIVAVQANIFNKIVEPYELVIGERSAVLHAGSEYAVFYVEVPAELLQSPIVKASFTINDPNGLSTTAGSYELHSADLADDYKVNVPAELVGQSFMFAIVNLHDLDNHTHTPLDLVAQIDTKTSSTRARMYEAFIFIN